MIDEVLQPADLDQPASQPAAPAGKVPLSQTDLDLIGGDDADAGETGDSVDDWFGAADADDAEDEDGDVDETEGEVDGRPPAREAPPEDPSDYALKIKDFEITERDEPLLESYQAIAHEIGIGNGEFNQLASWFLEQASAAQSQRVSEDKEAATAVDRALRRNWGQDYATHKATVQQTLKGLPPDLARAIRDARVGDGSGHRLVHDVRFVDLLRRMSGESSQPAARRENTRGRGRADVPAPFQSEEEMIKQIMKNDFDRYTREGWDRRYEALLARRGEA